MALIHDDQVEEIGWKGFEKTFAPLVLRERLIGGEIHFAPHVHDAVFNLPTRIAELGKDAVLRLVHENIAVGKVENFRAAMFTCPVPTRVPEFPAELKGDGGLAGASRHRQKQAMFAFE